MKRALTTLILAGALLAHPAHARHNDQLRDRQVRAAKMERKSRNAERWDRVRYWRSVRVRVKRRRASCWARHGGHVPIAQCFIRQAARRYGQPEGDMLRVANCESGYRWWISGHHEGMYQYLWSTWRSTPYGHRSPYSPKWSALATGWMWQQGRRGEWACQ